MKKEKRNIDKYEKWLKDSKIEKYFSLPMIVENPKELENYETMYFEGEREIALVFRVPDKWMNDFIKSKTGKIHEFSEEYKKKLYKMYPEMKSYYDKIFNAD